MFCYHCGAPLEEGASFCGSCGCRVEQEASSVRAESIPQPGSEPIPADSPASFAPSASPSGNGDTPPVPPASSAFPASFPPSGPIFAATDWKNSYFDGGTGAYIGISLLTGLLSVLSLGFALPALTCWMLRWKYRHTVVGGYRLKFNGTGGQLFGKWILWCLLCIVTIGIFGLWVPVKLMRWEVKHIEIDSAVLPPLN